MQCCPSHAVTLCLACNVICRQVHNPPTAEPIILSRRVLEPCSISSSNSRTDQPVGIESVKSCYALTQDSIQRLRGVSPQMGAGRACSTKQQLLEWRPYLKQVGHGTLMGEGVLCSSTLLMGLYSAQRLRASNIFTACSCLNAACLISAHGISHCLLCTCWRCSCAGPTSTRNGPSTGGAPAQSHGSGVWEHKTVEAAAFSNAGYGHTSRQQWLTAGCGGR